ncbi:ANTAR domain-containing protein [Streptomyces sp. LZ34]
MDQQLLAKTFVELADNLVADFDFIDFLRLLTDRCVGMLDASAAGVLLADRDGKLRVMAASNEQVRLLELFQLQNDEGPCLECFRTGTPVIVPDLSTVTARWPRFAVAAQRSGFGAVQALPMRLRDEVVGALNLFRTTPGPFDPADTPVAQALADVATISLLQQRTAQRSTVLNEQLQTALNSRVLIEQAKGKLAERQGIDMEQAFTTLRGYARAHNRRLADVARALINDSEPLAGLGS